MPVFGLGGMEIGVIALLGLIFFGRGKLTEFAREIRNFADELQGKTQEAKVVDVEKEVTTV